MSHSSISIFYTKDKSQFVVSAFWFLVHFLQGLLVKVGVDAAQHGDAVLGGEGRGGDGAAFWPPQQRLQPVVCK